MVKKKPLFWHLFPYFIAVVFFTLILTGWYLSHSMRQFHLEDTLEDLRVRTRLLSKQLIRYVMTQDEAAIDRAVKIAGRDAVARITVVLPNGSVIGDSHAEPQKMDNHADRPEIKTAMNNTTGTSIRYSYTLNQNMMYVAVPLVWHRDIVAVLRTAISVSDIDESLALIRDRMIIGGILVAMVAAAVSLLIARRISRPVEEIKIGAERYALGEFDHKLPILNVEELSILASSMNQMATSLDERIRTIIRQRNEIEAVLSSMQEGVLVVDNEDRILISNQAVAEMFNVQHERMQGSKLHQILRSVEFQRFLEDARESEKPLKGFVSLHFDKTWTFSVHSAPLKDATEKSIGTIFVLEDVTRIRSLENMRRELAINVSHEIRTPLTAIKGFVDTLTDKDFDGDPIETDRFLRIIAKHVERLVAVVDNLQSLSRLEDERQKNEITLKEADLIPIVDAAIEACADKARQKEVHLDASCDDGLTVLVNRTLIERALINLIDNAINSSQAGQTVTVNATSDTDRIEICVADQGAGIARKHQNRIFERFYRVDNSRARSAGGTGLGLAITKHIVLAHGGEIAVESVLGKGSRFKIYLAKK